MKPRNVLWTSALVALIVSVGMWTIAEVSATLLANQANYRYTAGAGSNAPFTAGATLSHTDLNNNFQALVNVLDGNIDRTNIPASVENGIARAWAEVASCDSAAASGTDCTLNESFGVTVVEATGVSGRLQVTLNYTPSDASFAVAVTTGNHDASFCTSGARATTAPHFTIQCWLTTTAPTIAAEQLIAVSFVVMDEE